MGDPLVVLEQGEPRGAGQGGGEHRGPDCEEPPGILPRPGRAGACDPLREVGGLVQVEGEERQDGQDETQPEGCEPRQADGSGAPLPGGPGEGDAEGQPGGQRQRRQEQGVLEPVGHAKRQTA